MFSTIAILSPDHPRPLRDKRKTRLLVEELEDRAVPATTIANPNNPSNATPATSSQNNPNTVANPSTTQNSNAAAQAAVGQSANSPFGNLTTIPAVTTSGGAFIVNNNPNGAVPQNGLNPGDQVAVYTGNVGSLPPDSSDTSQIGSQNNLLGLTFEQFEDLAGPTPLTNQDVADFIQAVAKNSGINPVRLSLLTVERPDEGLQIGQEAENGQPIEPRQEQPRPQNGQPAPQGAPGGPGARLDIPEPNLLALLEAPPPINANTQPPAEQKPDYVTPPRHEELQPPAPKLPEGWALLPPETEPAPRPTLGVWNAFFAEQGRSVDLSKLVKAPADNNYEEFTVPWYPPALGLALFLGGWSAITFGQEPQLNRRQPPRRPWRE